MGTHIDQVIEDLTRQVLPLEAACQSLLQSVQADPGGTRFWNLRVEQAMKEKRITRSVARALLDALEGCQTDRTVWIDSGIVDDPQKTAYAKGASPRDAGIRRDMDRLLNALVERTTHNVEPRAVNAPSSPLTGPVEWFDSAAIAAAARHPADPENIVPGSVLKDRYSIVSHLGAGGVGQVFEAVDLMSLGGREKVTIKVVAVNLRHQPAAYAALETAIRRTQHLSHPNIVSVRSIEQQGDRVFIVMEPLRGRWLSSLIREVRGRGLSYDIAWPIITGIANGLAHAHRNGIVHSDLSPHAVFLCDDGTAKIMSFGLVNAVPVSNESLDVLDTLTLRAYTEAYASDPWAQHSRPQPADDLYPLGVIAYEMLSGTHPFQRCSMAVARQKGMTFAPVAGLNSRARKLLERCLSFDRSERPRDAGRFLKKMQPGLVERMLAG